MTGILFGTGIGPGDPELMTLKAVRLIRENDTIAVPGEKPEESIAYQIAVQAVPELAEKELVAIPMPMTKNAKELEENHRRGAEKIEELLDAGKNVVFLTLGDPTVYSTYLYVHRRVLEDGYDARIVSGVTSFCAAAASLSEGLVENSEELHVIPASYQIEDALELSGTKVLMKAGKKMPAVKQFLKEKNCRAVMVENCGMENEHVYRKIEELPEEAGYYSLIIAKEQNAGNEKSDTRVNCCDKSSRKMEVATEQNTEEKRNDSIKWRADQMTEEMTGDLTENIEALPTEKAPEETAEKELSGQKLSTKELSTEEKLQQDAIEKKAYHPFDMRA